MIFCHEGAAIHPSAVRNGNLFLARASILKGDGEATSLDDLGRFANRACAYEFAVRCATAFVDGKRIPRPPFGQATAR